MERILTGYRVLAGRILTFSALILFFIAVALVIVFPPWYLATRHQGLYTVTVTAGATLGLVVFVYKRTRHNSQDARHAGWARLRMIGVVLFWSVFLYAVVALWAQGFIPVAVPATIVLAGSAGYYASGKKAR
jgi:hypothetical protein